MSDSENIPEETGARRKSSGASKNNSEHQDTEKMANKSECELVENTVHISLPNTTEEAANSISKSIDDKEEAILPSYGIIPGVENTPDLPEFEDELQPVAATISHSESDSSDPSLIPHKVKKIKWQDIEVPIITQNNNGPCPLLAILNAMVLKGDVTLPGDGAQLTGGELVSIVGNALFDLPRTMNVPNDMKHHLEQNIQDAVAILHKLLTGLDVNIKFSGVKDFEFTSELCVFDLLGVSLYHGWVVEPASEAGQVISNLSYNQLTNNIISWHDEALNKNNNDLLMKAMLCEEFMESSVSQLTIHGLFELASTLADEEVAVLFRNNHFSTIYKRKGQVYQLLTDQGFLNEDAVWETLSDVDATFSEFVCANFKPIHCNQSSTCNADMTKEQQINTDQQLAAMMQQEIESQQKQSQDFESQVKNFGLDEKTDEEIAKRLQEEEMKMAEEEQNRTQRNPRGAELPYSPQNNPNYMSDSRKKKECAIL